MTEVHLPDNTVNTMPYDGHGKLHRIEDSDGLPNIIWDGENILREADSGSSAVALVHLRAGTPQHSGESQERRRGLIPSRSSA